MKRLLSSGPRVYEARTRDGSVIASSDYARCAFKQGEKRKGGRIKRKGKERDRGGRRGTERRGRKEEGQRREQRRREDTRER